MTAATARILLVDDDEDQLALFETSLKTRGYQVTTANRALDGLKRLDEGAFDLLVSDVFMPDMNGRDLIAEARRKQPQLLIASFTATEEITDEELFDSGADLVLRKTERHSKICERIAALLHERRTE